MNKSVSIFICILIFFSAQAQAYLESKSFSAKGLEFLVYTNYFTATANYTRGGGEYEKLADGFQYQHLSSDFGLRWTPTNRFGVYGFLTAAAAQSQDLTSTRNNSSLSRGKLGIDTVLVSGKTYQIIPDFYVSYPFEKIDTQSDTVVLDEGSVEVTGALHYRADWGFFLPLAKIGYTHRDEDRSALAIYSVGGEFDFTTWFLGAEVSGYSSVTKDKFTDTPLDREFIHFRNGGAKRFYTVDPALLETNLWLRFDSGKTWGLQVGAGSTITGENTAAGYNAKFALTYRFANSQGYSRKSVAPLESDKFKEDMDDGVDQRIFEPSPLDESVKQELNETEKQLEENTKKRSQ